MKYRFIQSSELIIPQVNDLICLGTESNKVYKMPIYKIFHIFIKNCQDTEYGDYILFAAQDTIRKEILSVPESSWKNGLFNILKPKTRLEFI